MQRFVNHGRICVFQERYLLTWQMIPRSNIHSPFSVAKEIVSAAERSIMFTS